MVRAEADAAQRLSVPEGCKAAMNFGTARQAVARLGVRYMGGEGFVEWGEEVVEWGDQLGSNSGTQGRVPQAMRLTDSFSLFYPGQEKRHIHALFCQLLGNGLF